MKRGYVPEIRRWEGLGSGMNREGAERDLRFALVFPL